MRKRTIAAVACVAGVAIACYFGVSEARTRGVGAEGGLLAVKKPAVEQAVAAPTTAASSLDARINLPGPLLKPLSGPGSKYFRLKGTKAIVEVLRGGLKSAKAAPTAVRDANALAKRHPNVNFVYYGVSTWTMTRPARKAGYRDPINTAWKTFADGVSTEATTGVLQADRWTAYAFATDHHWKPRGAYQGYLDVIELLARNNRRISSRRVPFAQKVVRGVRYRGAMARAAGVKTTEAFIAMTGHDPKVHAYLGGVHTCSLILPRKLLTNPPKDPSVNLYRSFNGGDWAIVEYRKRERGAGNLLILGDSFSNSMEDLVASHFHRTYKVDLRHYAADKGHPFDIDAFIKQNHITDVVVMGRPGRVMSVPTALRTRQPVR